MIATDVGSAALILGKCCSSIINLDAPGKTTTLVQWTRRVDPHYGTVAKCEFINLVQTGTLKDGRLAMVERHSDLEDPILGESARRSRTTGDRERNVSEQALEIWSGDPQ